MKALSDIVMKLFSGQEDHPDLVAFLAWVQDEGGFPAMLERIQDRGAGELLTELLSGATQTLSSGHIGQLFSQSEISALAQRTGTTPQEVTAWMANCLPALLQHLAPEGHTLSGSDMLSRALTLLRDRLFPS
ncbi:TPA: DUF937 domain-containing protein [Salmonella enterica]|nr:DUF937 domain-containing protein [Salmonella enterica subsp. enterica serovar Montevideo]MCH5723052.1 YidB family protein [Salmonella enterica]EGH0794870.1 DUF937 domain-containing protein [Salmonella enterica subsp. enterica serovar Montevideo]EJT8386354.1 DUF937 domain-containing protein [Salmonella enterica subsp. enterica serovar Montevideo]ELM0668160.1 DUF937 domain-containing protein [Salmonella enterica subsp. enterica serovar Montevideo]